MQIMCYNNNRKREREVTQMITKKFEHKGQMINYYNKAKYNANLKMVVMGYFVGEGYCVKYYYK